MKKHLILSLVVLTIVQVGFAQTAPSISSLSSKSGAIGELITIDGSNFNASVGSNIVYFGNIKAVITSESSSQLTVQIPPTTS